MAVELTAKKSAYISRYKNTVTSFLDIVKTLKELRTEWDSLGYSGTLVDADFVSDNNHISAANLTSAVTTAQAVTDLMAANGNAHNSNFYKLVR
jgi:hypothetical protein